MRNVLNLSISFVKFPLGSGIPRMSSSSSSKAFGALTINCMVLEVVLMEVQCRNFKYFNLVTDNVECLLYRKLPQDPNISNLVTKIVVCKLFHRSSL